MPRPASGRTSTGSSRQRNLMDLACISPPGDKGEVDDAHADEAALASEVHAQCVGDGQGIFEQTRLACAVAVVGYQLDQVHAQSPLTFKQRWRALALCVLANVGLGQPRASATFGLCPPYTIQLRRDRRCRRVVVALRRFLAADDSEIQTDLHLDGL